MPLTDEQANAVDLFGRHNSLKISAFAGTGKTTTLTELAKSTKESGLYLAFNKAIASEAQKRFPTTVDSRTTHSLAYRAAPKSFSRNPGKLTEAIQGNRIAQTLELEELVFADVTLKSRSLGYLVVRTVQRFCQSSEASISSRHVPLPGKLALLSEADQEDFRRYVAELAAGVWARMSTADDPVPLGHDGYLKLWSLSRPKLNYDFILLDEAQDTNEAVLSVLREQDCRLTLVGDRHQQIYEWRGAVNAMEKFPTESSSYLTQSFRFGPEIARAATDILRMLDERRPVTGNPRISSTISTSGSPDAILCRTNAGVMTVVVDALRSNAKPHVVGGVSDLIRMVDDVTRLKAGTPAESPELFGFANWAEVAEFAFSDDGQSLRSFVTIINENGEAQLLQALNRVATNEESANVTVSTGHKAKGREWNTVRLHSDFEPRKFSPNDPRKPLMNEEELRLLYVAATRPKLQLIAPSKLARLWGLDVADDEIPPLAAPKTETRATVVAAPVQAPPPLPKPTLPSGARVVPKATAPVSRPPPPSISPPTASPAVPKTTQPTPEPESGGLGSLFRSLFGSKGK